MQDSMRVHVGKGATQFRCKVPCLRRCCHIAVGMLLSDPLTQADWINVKEQEESSVHKSPPRQQLHNAFRIFGVG